MSRIRLAAAVGGVVVVICAGVVFGVVVAAATGTPALGVAMGAIVVLSIATIAGGLAAGALDDSVGVVIQAFRGVRTEREPVSADMQEIPRAAGRMVHSAAWFMPRSAGQRWRAEVESFLFEVPAGQRPGARRSYLAGAPRVIAVSWVAEIVRRVRVTGDGPR